MKDQQRNTTARESSQSRSAVAERPKGPKLYPAHGEAKPRAIAIYCVDPRFQEAIEMFLDEELGLKKGTFVPFALGGGVSSLANPFERPKDAKFGRESILFYVDHFPMIERIILVNHEDCGKYAALTRVMPSMLRGVRDMLQRQIQDLKAVTTTIQQFLPRPLTIERYYASFANSERTQIKFEKQ